MRERTLEFKHQNKCVDCKKIYLWHKTIQQVKRCPKCRLERQKDKRKNYYKLKKNSVDK